MKKFIAAVTAALTLSAFSCSSKSSSSEAPSSGAEALSLQTMYKAEKLPLPDGFVSSVDMFYEEGAGARLLFTDSAGALFAADYDEDFKVAATKKITESGGDTTDRYVSRAVDGTLRVLEASVEFDPSLDPGSYADDLDQNASQEAYKKYYESGEYRFAIDVFDAGLNVVSTLEPDIGKYIEYGANAPQGFACSGEGYVVATMEGALLLDAEGNVTDSAAQKSHSEVYVTDADGRLCYCNMDGYGYPPEEYPLNAPIETTSFGERIYMSRGAGVGAKGYKLYFMLSDGFYGADKDDNVVKLVDYASSNVKASEICAVAPVAEGKYLVYGAGAKGRFLLALTARPEGYVSDKKKVVLGKFGNGNSIDIADVVADYNNFNDEYEIEIKEYSDADTLRNDVITGKSPDILFYHDYDLAPRFVNLGAFADFYDLWDKYGGTSPDEILPNVRKALSCKGGLYVMSTSFSVRFFFADKDVLGPEYENWDMNEFLDVAENLPEDMLLGSLWSFIGQDSVFYFLVTSNLSNWIDLDDASCRFDTDEYVRALKYIQKANVIQNSYLDNLTEEETILETEEDSHSIKKRKALLFDIFSEDLETYILKCGLFHYTPFEVTWLTPPNRSSSGTLVADQLFSVLRSGDCEEGGWDFASYLMSYDYQVTPYAESPTNEKAFDKKWKDQQKRLAEAGTTGGVFNGYRSEVNSVLTDEEFDFIVDKVKSCSNFDSYYKSICDIIIEEYNRFENGECSAEECAEMTQDRVSLYLSENN